MNKFRNPYLATILAFLVLFVSCSDENFTDQQSFDYSVYQNNKSTNIDFTTGNSSKSNVIDTRDSFIQVLGLINDEFGTNVYLNNLDEQFLSTSNQAKSNQTVNINSYLNQTDINLIENFNEDIKQLSFNEALDNFENNVLQLNLNDSEFQKYNELANVLSLVENSFPGMLANDTESSNDFQLKSDSDCAWAIAAYTLATISLSSCATGALCPVAIAAKIIAFRNMISACSDD